MEQVKKKGFLERLLGSRVKTSSVTLKEKILGHLVGPLGLILVVNTIAALVEKFFTQQAGLLYQNNPEALANIGNVYEGMMTGVKIGSVIFGILIGMIIEKIPSKYGRFRPLYLLIGFITIIIGFTMFLFPGNTLGESYWYYFFINFAIYHVFGNTYFLLFRDNIVSLVTRNNIEKHQVNFFRKLCWTLISGILIGFLVSSVVLPFWLDHDLNGYAILMIILSIIAIPLFLLEYYYTKERIIEEETEESDKDVNKVKFIDQMKALLTDKYFMLLFVLTTVGTIVDNFKGGNVQYFYIKYLLGGDKNGGMFSIYQIITGIPTGLGAIFAYPLSRKFGVKNVTFVGYALVLLGSVAGILFPTNIPVAMVAGFFKNVGMIPNAYIFTTLVLYSYDHIEFKNGFRVEGLLGASLLSAFAIALSAPFAGGYESNLLQMGFTDVEGVTPNQNVLNFMSLSFYGFDILMAILSLIILPFVNVEKKIGFINEELLRRSKQECLDKGLVWIPPEEKKKIEEEQARISLEKNRIKDLKAKCEKKGLDFETENNKYLEKVHAKEEKKRLKTLKKEEKKKNKQNN